MSEIRKRIVIDLLGSDKGPGEICEGAKLLLEDNPDVDVTLVGDESLLKSKDYH